MTKWEYVVVPLADAGGLNKSSNDLTPSRLNELGAQGWEAVTLTHEWRIGRVPVVLLKRPVE